MEHIPATHALKVGMQYPGRVKHVWPTGMYFELDLTRLAPGRSPTLGADLVFDYTVNPDKARGLAVGDSTVVVLVGYGNQGGFDWVTVSLPADPSWLTWNNETVRRLARHIRETGETGLLPVLADALEEAGCTDAALLDHCREPHEAGERSWAVELLATQQ